MKYFLDTEFIEGVQDNGWWCNSKPTIDLISIGICSSDGREYYAISKDFNLKEAWNRYNWKEHKSIHKEDEGKILHRKIYWLRENVLKPIWEELHLKDLGISYKAKDILQEQMNKLFSYKSLAQLIKKYGKSNKQIAEEIVQFVGYNDGNKWLRTSKEGNYITEITSEFNNNGINFYGYYSDYDWVVFCWLFGRMIDLPKGFPMYCIDLKQILDEKYPGGNYYMNSVIDSDCLVRVKKVLMGNVNTHPDFPKQTNEHNALADAKWNKELYQFLQYD